ncbi:unnamed protein product (macronuclear) [Paramecium tetraurelia]|uniref:Protein kinase domain-containing protein n=1 Tax=Paramecium tetraurelia TaxID=5888 RepID=A0CR29_PARTE|nr:uncharacterized protein GSPATT00009559001 [Paramecium tetraurelia]CAK73246.1 unnamed protein product [Paramecium tetraurelia]|eukprot:XP_001440643.1 hypothetical protein (macronuclear) [Paramecium tetraurelia strain d4-2]
MGPSWGSPQKVQENIYRNRQYLQEEKDAQLTPQKCPHLRHVKHFDFIYKTINQDRETVQMITFECYPDFTKLKSLEELSNNNELNPYHFKEIFKQLIEGLYELHTNKLFGRCLSLECITYVKETNQLNYGSFGFFHSADQLQFPPECLYKLMNTYEADFWQVAKMMWQMYKKKKDYYGKQIVELGKDLLAHKQIDQKIDDKNEPKEVVRVVNSLLSFYCGQRMTIEELLDQECLDFEVQKREEMKNFYRTDPFELYFLNLMKITRQRDSQKIFVYYIDLESPICQEYRKEIFQILLTYIALQLSLHYPNNNQQAVDRYPKLLSTLSKYLTMSSKILKDKLVLQEKGFLDNRNKFLTFRDEIVKSHDQAYRFEKFVLKQWQLDFQELKGYDDEQIIKIIHFKLYQFKASAAKPKSVSQKILLNLLCNLKVNDDNFNSGNFKEDLQNLLKQFQLGK